MDIVIHCMGMPFNGDTILEKSLGGSETAAYYQARELRRRGHRVTVFSNIDRDKMGIFDEVQYLTIGPVTQQTPLGRDFEFYARNTPHDVLIIQRHPGAFHGQFASKVNIWQLHDLALFRTAMASAHGMWQVDSVTGVSKWHKDQICEVYNFSTDYVRVVPNGVDPELYASADPLTDLGQGLIDVVTNLKDAGKFLCLYQSRPERGLEHLVRPGGIMDRLADTEAHLLVCGYDNTVPQMRAYYARLEEQGKALGNVTNVGALNKKQLAALQRHCDLLLYPTEFEEVSCISVMEAMHARLPVLTSAVGALPETLEVVDAGAHLIKLKDGGADEGEFVRLVTHYANTPGALAVMRVKQLKAAKLKTWERAVDALESVLEAAFARRRGTTAAALRHSIEHSDVAFANSLLDPSKTTAAETWPRVVAKTEEEIDELYKFAHQPEQVLAHYLEHQTKYYDRFEEKVIGENVTMTSRFKGVAAFLAEEMHKRGGKARVLDYGCAHGHYLIPLAGAYPDGRFVGIDISERAIGAAQKWVERAKLNNVSLYVGAEALLNSTVLCPPVAVVSDVPVEDGNAAVALNLNAERDWFDVIIAGEVLEHVWDWRSLLDKFKGVLRPGGVIIVTTPSGKWEWTGTEEFRKAREHLHHFERADIVDICADNPHVIMFGPAGHDVTGESLGSWVWRVEPRTEFGTPNLQRKRDLLAPRQTVSACLIVKDGERTLRRCIESIADWVDEIIVAIDPATTDRTYEILENLQKDFKWRTITILEGKEALKDGFDAARNVTVDAAQCDWVLWLDADEEVREPWAIHKYLRASCYDAFGFPQIHYSTNPPQVLTTDYPCRLFRRNGRIKFYGLVHEHPEDEVGKGVVRSTIRGDVQFAHCGYVDERVRRERYARNLPLLLQDRKINPKRGLNRFLMLRDIAQKLIFEQEQTQGFVVEGQPEEAREGIVIFEEMADKDPVRAVIEALKYYSHCVAVCGQGFEGRIDLAFKTDQAPDLNCELKAEGRFHSKEFYQKLLTKLTEEATKHYESKYL